MEYRHWGVICVVLVLAAVTSVGVGVPLALKARRTAGLTERLEMANVLLQQVPLIDGHNDFPWNLRNFVHNEVDAFNFSADLRQVAPWNLSRWSHTDLPRLRQGRVGAQFWAAYVPCKSQWMDAVPLSLEQIDVVRRLVQQYPQYLTFATSAQDIVDAHKSGRIASLLGVEGGHSLGNSLAVLRTFYRSGVRYLTLTHTCDTPWATSASGEASKQGISRGLNDFGKAVILEMNRLGMIVDLSHTSLRTTQDALVVSRAPVIFSHSSAQALCNTSRNVPDHILEQVALKGGMVMVNFYSEFITCNTSAKLTDVIAHLNHIRSVAGIDHVGLGAGYDGINWTPEGLEDVSRYPYLFAELVKDDSWSEEDLKKLAGQNFLRVFRTVEQVSRQMAVEKVRPRQDRVDPLKLIYTSAARCSWELSEALNKQQSSQPNSERGELTR
ncbi:dipeptidase 1-like [Amphibalanus amphitrite]|uniref:dipeptidase 1-like n=1 Tax=Amphibalanus amphitrite TaxID=1232801 RepID=UPI001C91ABDF|nr:dipeptidase 1-like [Amphibalanus amphitrite]